MSQRFTTAFALLLVSHPFMAAAANTVLLLNNAVVLRINYMTGGNGPEGLTRVHYCARCSHTYTCVMEDAAVSARSVDCWGGLESHP
jgi:hypothetical protein